MTWLLAPLVIGWSQPGGGGIWTSRAESHKLARVRRRSTSTRSMRACKRQNGVEAQAALPALGPVRPHGALQVAERCRPQGLARSQRHPGRVAAIGEGGQGARAAVVDTRGSAQVPRPRHRRRLWSALCRCRSLRDAARRGLRAAVERLRLRRSLDCSTSVGSSTWCAASPVAPCPQDAEAPSIGSSASPSVPDGSTPASCSPDRPVSRSTPRPPPRCSTTR
jgi:hypothetical protein